MTPDAKKTPPRTALLIAVAAVGAMVLTGCSGDGSGSSAGPSSTSATTTAESSSASPASTAGPGPDADLATTTFPVDLDRALEIANTTQPGGTVTKIEMDYDRTSTAWVWKIDTQQNTDQHEIKIDAKTARVLADARDQESPKPTPVDPRKLSPADAQARALALVPGSVAKWSLEYDDGVQRYVFDIGTSGSQTQGVAVNVDTGVATKK